MRDILKINHLAYIPLLLMMVWELMHGIVGEFSFTSYLQGFTELIFCSFVISLPNKKFDYPFIARALAVCVAFSCTILLLKLLPEVSYNFEKIFEGGDYRFGVNDESVDSYVMTLTGSVVPIGAPGKGLRKTSRSETAAGLVSEARSLAA